ncbi:MAG TPA: c-type cytochrome domain-containing protein, partial [Gemmataceae bacterium]|nr:c-type cytochrome domain-containing protein [Gemmataceae bacterium]
MRHVLVPVAVLVWLAPIARANEPGGLEFFEKKIRPVLAEQCLSCHSAAAAQAKKLKAGLYLDTRDGLLKGGDSGPAVVVGKPGDSLLVRAMHFSGDTKMPPKGKLPAAVIADFEKWVAMGLPDPRTATVVRKQVGMSVEEGRKFWAFRPVTSPAPPTVRGGTRTD